MINRFNNLDSKRWLLFQKSWFKFHSKSELFLENLSFFTKPDRAKNFFPNVFYYGDKDLITELSNSSEMKDVNIILPETLTNTSTLDFAFIDLTNKLANITNQTDYENLITKLTFYITQIGPILSNKKFVCILAINSYCLGSYNTFAWDIAKQFSNYLSLKDEKIGCFETGLNKNSNYTNNFEITNGVIYCLYFRKDEYSQLKKEKLDTTIKLRRKTQFTSEIKFELKFPSWQIVKPPARKGNEILHPAKYPEALIEKFIKHFSSENENVFDPMSGTGSTQVAALKLKRNAYGIELSEFFGKIAIERCQEQNNSNLFNGVKNEFNLKIMDARNIKKSDFPPIHYIITSPPYWDMLNMKGAENQAMRRKKGLRLNYSDSKDDLGNICDYETFLNQLVEIYFKLFELLEPGRFMTIIVKNVKKKGKNFPLAWDLANALSEKFILCPESLWLQDDLPIAPYGYGNTWVSNTFHHYCLNFQKPIMS